MDQTAFLGCIEVLGRYVQMRICIFEAEILIERGNKENCFMCTKFHDIWKYKSKVMA